MMQQTSPAPVLAVLFDFDGTLTSPGHLDFAAIRTAIGCPAGMSILTYIESLEPTEGEKASMTLDEFELEAASEVAAAPGLEELLLFLRSRSVDFGILTRNSQKAVERSLRNMSCCTLNDFSCVITRDDDIPVKPAPDGVREGARRMAVRPEEMFVVGDYIFDIEAGNRAGAVTVFLDVLPERSYEAPNADYVFADLRSLISVPQTHWHR